MEKGDSVPGTGGPPPEQWERLARFLAGESPPAEAQAVRDWLAASPERQAMLRALDRAMDHGASRPAAGVEVEAALARVHARMEPPAIVPPRRRPAPPPSTGTRRGWGSPALRTAAAVVVLLAGFFAWRVVRGGPPLATPAVFATAVGERDSLRLPDGTRVLLGPGSRLVLGRGYGERAREVELRGEAMFNVPHDDARPFIVHAGAARVRDIGTVFTVEADSGGPVRVVVTEGAVAVRGTDSGEDDEMILREGERGVLADGAARAERTAASDDDLAWTRGELVFRDAPLAEVAAELRRWHGVEVRAGDAAVAGRRLTASFAGESPRAVLDVVALALGAELTMHGDTVVLHAASAGGTR